MPIKRYSTKVSKPKITQLTFAIGITFDNKEAFNISDTAITPITIIKKSLLFNINTKNKNKRKKNN